MGRIRFSFAGIIFSALCLFIVGVAIVDLRDTRDYASEIYIRSLVFNGKPPSPERIAAYAEKLDLEKNPLPCRQDITDAAINVLLVDMDNHPPSIDGAGWIKRLTATERRLREGLACFPTNGNLWLRLAVVRWFLGGSPEEQARLLTLSQHYAPVEYNTVIDRVDQWKRVSPAVVTLARPVMLADVRAAMVYLDPKDANALLADAPAGVYSAMTEIVPLLDPARLSNLENAGLTDLSGEQSVFGPSRLLKKRSPQGNRMPGEKHMAPTSAKMPDAIPLGF